MPYWFESFEFFLAVGCARHLDCKSLDCQEFRKCADTEIGRERIYFAAMLLVAWAALRTVIANEGCWLIHMSSIGAMVLGATFPSSEPIVSEFENEMMLS